MIGSKLKTRKLLSYKISKEMDRLLAIGQAGSGLVFSTFTLLHLGGHALAPLSFKWANTALFASRELYQASWIEPWVVGASLLIHSGTSMARFWIRYQKESKMTKKTPVQSPALESLWLHRMSGLLISSFVYIHILATRLVPLACN